MAKTTRPWLLWTGHRKLISRFDKFLSLVKRIKNYACYICRRFFLSGILLERVSSLPNHPCYENSEGCPKTSKRAICALHLGPHNYRVNTADALIGEVIKAKAKRHPKTRSKSAFRVTVFEVHWSYMQKKGHAWILCSMNQSACSEFIARSWFQWLMILVILLNMPC